MLREDQIATVESVSRQILDALGVDSTARVTRLVLTFEGGELPTVELTQLLRQRQGLDLCRLMTRRFDLVPRDGWTDQRIRYDDSAQESAPL